MATRTKISQLPSASPASAVYERDYYSWALEQAEALRSGRLEVLDFVNLAEEVEDLGREQFDKLESALRLILLHLSKWDRQPERRSRSWALTILRERDQYGDVIGDNPGLKSRRDDAVRRAYRKARIEAAGETGLPLKAFPDECPYSLDDILSRPVEWPEG